MSSGEVKTTCPICGNIPLFCECAAASESVRQNQGRCACPICGHEFDEVKPINVCENSGHHKREWTPEELIGPYDDYEWCQ